MQPALDRFAKHVADHVSVTYSSRPVKQVTKSEERDRVSCQALVSSVDGRLDISDAAIVAELGAADIFILWAVKPLSASSHHFRAADDLALTSYSPCEM